MEVSSPHAQLPILARLIRYLILTSTTAAGSGHPSSSLSAVELMAGLLFGGHFRFDIAHPEYPGNDRLIFSKGHAAPLLYALWAAAGAIPVEELTTLRKFKSRLEGHPSMALPFTEAATGSLGQGLSVGLGMALNAKMDRTNGTNETYRTYVLLGDSEMAEGSVWEAIQLAAYYKLDNPIAILDVNRLGQRGETMYGHDVEAYAKRVGAFGWETIVVRDGHSFPEILKAFDNAQAIKNRPTMIIAKTVKGKGVSFIEDKEGWHGKPLSADELKKALTELGAVDKGVRGVITPPPPSKGSAALYVPLSGTQGPALQDYSSDKPVSTRRAYGNALARIYPQFPNMVVLDAEVKNSTYAEIFEKAHPERFFEMYIAEQNMVGVALGLARRGKIPFVSTFAAFLTRAFDQIRMAQYSKAHLVFCGSHAGVSIGEDGSSQMGLEDLAMFRALLGSVVLYPSDAVSTEKLVEEAARAPGIVYIRTSRPATPILYRSENQESPHQSKLGTGQAGIMNQEDLVAHDFKIGGSCTLRSSSNDRATIVAAGVTLHEALVAYDELKKEGIAIRVIDLYSIKPLDIATLTKAARETKAIITVEDHFAEGGIGEAVASMLSNPSPPPSPTQGEGEKRNSPPLVGGVRGGGECAKVSIIFLAVRKTPGSGKPEELLDTSGISRHAIVKAVKELL